MDDLHYLDYRIRSYFKGDYCRRIPKCECGGPRSIVAFVAPSSFDVVCNKQGCKHKNLRYTVRLNNREA